MRRREKMLRLKQNPEDSVEIVSGTVGVFLKNVIVFPIIYEGILYGVMEVASPGEFTPLHERLFLEVAERMGVVIKNIKNQIRTVELLEQSQFLSQEMKVKTSELQLAYEELEQRSLRLNEQKNEIETKSLEIQKGKEEIEKKAKDLELANKYKSEFLANMSHELRTPLNSMLLLSNSLSKNKEGNLTPDQVEAASYINRGGKSLLDLINEILDLSKIEAGVTTVNIEEISILEIADGIHRDFSHVAKEKGLKLDISVEEDLPATMHTDGDRLGQILKNLISNAIKFTEKGYVRVDFSLPSRETEFSDKSLEIDNSIAISVTDTGIGIYPHKKELIFEAFRQGEEGVAKKYGGTGLGLSISSKLAHLLGGEIQIASEIGKGSTFTLFLAIKSESPLKKQEDAMPIAQNNKEKLFKGFGEEPGARNRISNGDFKRILKNKKILVVDDDMRNVFALSQLLQEHGALPIKADSGKRALEFLENDPKIDLVLMDIMMPEMDGYETIRRIRKAALSMPIIAVTAKAMKGDRQACLDVGANDYIAKPLDENQLFEMIASWAEANVA